MVEGMIGSRIESVDVMRGIAIFWMVSFQIFSFFTRAQIYDYSWYLLLDFVNWLPIFMFVSGISVWLMVNKRLSLGFSRCAILFHGLKRYIFYIFLGLMLCLWCFDFETFLGLNEILVAVGIYALSTLCLLLVFFGTEWIFILLAFIVYELSLWFRGLFQFQAYPFYLMLPFYFLGVFSASFITKKSVKKLILLSFLLLLLNVPLAFLGDDFSYSAGTLGFVVFNLFLSVLLSIMISIFQQAKFLKIFSFAGRNALFFYVFHFAVLFKLAVFLGISQTFDLLSSILLTCLSVTVIFICAHLKPKMLHYLRKVLLRLKSF